ncbi:MAG: hypothetical protein AAGM67_04770, partial [Bacteroidota bacterium]
MRMMKQLLPFLGLSMLLLAGFQLIGLTGCETVEPVIEDVEELESTFDGTYFYNFAALQQASAAMIKLDEAIKNQQFDDLGEENMLALQQSYALLLDNLSVGLETVGRIRCRPPYCPPPNPCSDNPLGIDVCDKLRLSLETLADFRLPETWSEGRLIELLDEQGEPVAAVDMGDNSLFERGVRYKMDVPQDFKSGTLRITETRNGDEVITQLNVEIPQ